MLRRRPARVAADRATVGGDVVSRRPPPSGQTPPVRFRPRPALRFVGPVLVLLGLAAVAVSPPVGLAVLVVGAIAATALVPMVEVTETAVRFRGLFGTVVLAVPQITEVRLRRVPLGGPRPPRRAGRPGRLSIRPIRLRVVAGEETLQLTVACWRHWADLVERILIVTGIEADVRTLGRIERYG